MIRRKITAVLLCFMLLLLFAGFGSAPEKPTDKKLVALTFDDGPHPKYTEKILDILKKHNVRATFFVVGSNAERFPELVKREIEEGHEIGNHTYSHPNMKSITYDELQSELSQNGELLFSLTGVRTALFRPPCGEISNSVSSIAEDGEYKLVLWDIDTRDWEHISKEAIVKKVTSSIKGDSIILMHDFIGGTSHTPEALDEIIETLLADGYEFVTVSELG